MLGDASPLNVQLGVAHATAVGLTPSGTEVTEDPRLPEQFSTGCADLQRMKRALDCPRVVGTEVGVSLVRLSP